jgi:23S rRNA (cytosine1962-C5)-methyltransferase
MKNPQKSIESQAKSYRLLDCGQGRKLEMLGDVCVERQAAVAFWPISLASSEWEKTDAVHVRSEKGGGFWRFKESKTIPKQWWVKVGGLELKTKLTDFGHCGFFSEQQIEWQWLRAQIRCALKDQSECRVLNLFAYTGGGTISMAQEGALVTHVDAAQGIVDWAKENAQKNLENHVGAVQPRFIVEDCQKFIEREIRRGSQYHAVVMDPPSFGRGSKNEVFQIEKNIGPLLELISKVLVDRPRFFHFSSHTPGFSPRVLRQLLAAHVPQLREFRGEIQESEMWIPVESQGAKSSGSIGGIQKVLPSGQVLRLGASGS